MQYVSSKAPEDIRQLIWVINAMCDHSRMEDIKADKFKIYHQRTGPHVLTTMVYHSIIRGFATVGFVR